jgi:hypothetical protein
MQRPGKSGNTTERRGMTMAELRAIGLDGNIFRQFKALCALEDLTISQAIELILKEIVSRKFIIKKKGK